MLNESVQNLTEKTFGTPEPVDFDPKTPEEYDLVYGPALKQAEKKGDKITIHILQQARAKLVAKSGTLSDAASEMQTVIADKAEVSPAKIPDAAAAMETAVTEEPGEEKSAPKDPKYESSNLKKLLSTFFQTDIALSKAILAETKKTNEFLKKKEENVKKKEVVPVQTKTIMPTEAIVEPAKQEEISISEEKENTTTTPIPRKKKKDVELSEENPRESILDKAYNTSYKAVSGFLDNIISPSKSDLPMEGSPEKDTPAGDTSDNMLEKILVEAKKTNTLLAGENINAQTADAYTDENKIEASGQVIPAKTESPKDVQKKNSEVEGKKSGSLVDSLLEKGGDLMGKGGGALGKVASVASRVALPALAVAGAGAAGYAAGTWLNENTNIQENIAGGIDTVKGWFGNSDEDKQKAADAKNYQDNYEKRVKEGKLTAKSAAFFEQQGIKVDKSKITEVPEAAKSPVTSAVEKSVQAQDANADAAKTQQVTPPPMVLNTTNNVGSGGSSPTIISGMNIRNSESTFDRVQMQNYWSRTI